jgi:histidinol-phosphate aminotransferase
VDVVHRTFVAYSVNHLAQLAARAAISNDEEHIAKTRKIVRQARSFLKDVCGRIGLDCIGGEGNYLMIRSPVNDLLMYRRFMKKGMMVRSMTGFRFPGWIRVTLREMPVMKAFADVLADEIEVLRA